MHDDDHHEHPQKKALSFPSEITFKAVYRHTLPIEDRLRGVFAGHGLECVMSSRLSRNGKFISYTFTAVFPGEELLNSICAGIAAIEGFRLMI
jgi:hypothetical protein